MPSASYLSSAAWLLLRDRIDTLGQRTKNVQIPFERNQNPSTLHGASKSCRLTAVIQRPMLRSSRLDPTDLISVRDRILEATEQIILNLGPAHLTLDCVAERAGVSKGGLLYHFNSKERLLSALSSKYLNAMKRSFTEGLSADGAREATWLKARVEGLLCDGPSLRTLGAALLGTFANAPQLLGPIRQALDDDSRDIIESTPNSARAFVVTLAIDGLLLRESLSISPFSKAERDEFVSELLRLAEEAYG